MSLRRILLFLFAVLMVASLVGCEKYGKVLQGRVVEYNKDKRQVTFITAVAQNWENPHYLALPPVTMSLPDGSKALDPEPTVGCRVELDMAGRKFVIYDKALQSFKEVTFTPVETRKEVPADDPALLDEAGKPKDFPRVDKEKKTITLYSKRQKVLTTVQVADEYLTLPPVTWVAGDEIRVYYMEQGKIQQYINLSKNGTKS